MPACVLPPDSSYLSAYLLLLPFRLFVPTAFSFLLLFFHLFLSRSLPVNPSPPHFAMPSEDHIQAATALKVQGNKAFAEHEWPTAIEFYTQAISKYDREPSFFCNRAQVC